MKRRQFIQGMLTVAGVAALGSGCHVRHAPVGDGALQGVSHQLGHRLRTPSFPTPSHQMQVKVAILGGGIAGLSAAWKLRRSGFNDFHLFELESETGGNSRYASYPESRAPWGAHYLPVPTQESRAVRELLEEEGLLKGYGPRGEPLYDERSLCHAPQERLYIYGRWQEGVFPHSGATSDDLAQLDAFHAHVETWKTWRDAEGRKAFAIPIAMSSRDAGLMELDRLSMAHYMDQHGWTAPRLRWYVEYGCRDDYGSSLDATSAWAGLHYFASRDGGGYADTGALFTWPEGNGWLVSRLRAHVGQDWTGRALVFNVQPDGETVQIDVFDPSAQETTRVTALATVYSLPSFTAPYVVAPYRQNPPSFLKAFAYAPWAVANVVLKEPPGGGSLSDTPLCWDNVIYGSSSLGYVVATHQSFLMGDHPTVLTWYRPYPEADAAAQREAMLARPWESWRDEVVRELESVHPGITGSIQRVDVMLYGHAMIRPQPGFIWGGGREAAAEPLGRIHFAHSDLSGISIFEEAQYHGVRAAESVMTALSHPFKSSLK